MRDFSFVGMTFFPPLLYDTPALLKSPIFYLINFFYLRLKIYYTFVFTQVMINGKKYNHMTMVVQGMDLAEVLFPIVIIESK